MPGLHIFHTFLFGVLEQIKQKIFLYCFKSCKIIRTDRFITELCVQKFYIDVKIIYVFDF